MVTPLETGQVVFRDGKVVGAERSGVDSKVGASMVEAGVITQHAHEAMLQHQEQHGPTPAAFEAVGLDLESFEEALAKHFERLRGSHVHFTGRVRRQCHGPHSGVILLASLLGKTS